jgi:hypothetical protein
VTTMRGEGATVQVVRGGYVSGVLIGKPVVKRGQGVQWMVASPGMAD